MPPSPLPILATGQGSSARATPPAGTAPKKAGAERKEPTGREDQARSRSSPRPRGGRTSTAGRTPAPLTAPPVSSLPARVVSAVGKGSWAGLPWSHLQLRPRQEQLAAVYASAAAKASNARIDGPS